MGACSLQPAGARDEHDPRVLSVGPEHARLAGELNYGRSVMVHDHERSVNLPTLTDGASAPSARLELLGITVFTPPRPTGLAPRDWRMIGLAFARTPRSLSTRPGSGRYSGLSPFGAAPCGVPPSGLLSIV